MSVQYIRVLLASTMIFFFLPLSWGQEGKHNYSFHIGYAHGKPDHRYDFLEGEYPGAIIQSVRSSIKDATNDNEYFLGFTYNYRVWNRLYVGTGLGYAQLRQDFLLPVNGGDFFGAVNRPFFWRRYSRYHMLQISPEINFEIIKNESFTLGINSRLMYNISFRKEINYREDNVMNLAANKTELFATELYPGIFVRFGKFRFDLNYRLLHWKYRDDALANNGLRVDTYNPSKLRFQISYELGDLKRKD